MDLEGLGAGPDEASRLRRAGILTPADLAEADLQALSDRTGLAPSKLRAWRGAASRATGPPVGMRIVLPAQGVRARVFDGKDWRADVPIVTVTLAEDEDAVMAEQTGDAVVLKELSPTAFVRVAGAWHGGVPIFKARESPDGSVREVRVTVEAIRERRPAPAGREQGPP